MPTRFDVVVLGSGVAGTAAALAAAQQGAHTCVVTGAPGASALFAGSWRGGCPVPMRAALAAIGYELHTCNAELPHPYGHLAQCDLAPPSHLAASLADGSVVIGIAGLPGFNADILAQQWSARAGVQVASAVIELPQTPQTGWSPVSLAAMIERQPTMLHEPIERALHSCGATRAITPAVLGTKHDNAARQIILSGIDAEVGEALGVAPSLPGWRLHNALKLCLNAARVAVFESKGLASARQNGRIDAVELMNGDVIAGRSFVLATGKFAGGGIEADSEFREPALACPVWTEHLGEKFERVDSLLLTNPEHDEEQPLLSAGVHADADHRPLNPVGDVVYENVFVAGSVRAGWNVASNTIGAAASDGWQAGLKASA